MEVEELLQNSRIYQQSWIKERNLNLPGFFFFCRSVSYFSVLILFLIIFANIFEHLPCVKHFAMRS